MKSCAIIETFSGHDHVIPSAIHYLQKLGYRVDVYSTTPQFKEVSKLLPNLEYDALNFSPPQYGKGNLAYYRDRFFRGFQSLQFLQKYDLVFLNTFREELAITSAISRTCRNVLAVSHTPGHLLEKRRLRSFLRHGHQVFVLSEAMGARFQLPWVSPLTYAEFNEPRRRDNGKPCVFCVSGTVRFTGRNYKSLARTVAELKKSGETAFRIKILGRHETADCAKFREAIQQQKVEGFFDFVENKSHEDYFRELYASDFLLPLIDRYEEPISDRHYEQVITSSIFLALGINVPMVVERELAQAYRIEGACFEHQGGKLVEGMLAAMHSAPETVMSFKQAAAERCHSMQAASLESLKAIIHHAECKSRL